MGQPAIYRQRHPPKSALYQCLEHYWEEFKQAYTPLYEKDYGPLRPVVEKTVERFLECGILRHGFARIRCGSCHEEYLLAFSCKTRCFCPSCQAKRVAAFVEWVTEEILEPVDHRQLVWTIPRVLRPTFGRDRRLLGELARCAWRTLKDYTQARWPDPAAAPGAIVAIQTYGDQLNWHPHLHSLVSHGVWDRQGQFHPFGPLDDEGLTRLFQHHVLEMLTSQRRLSREFADRLRCWQPSGFQVYCGPGVDRDDQSALERLSAYILRPSFAGTRLQYQAQTGQIQYRTNKGVTRSMDALDWIALVTSHIPDPHQQMVRYYGRYSNASRGKRRKQSLPLPRATAVDSSPQPHSPAQHFAFQRRRNWARVLKKIYEVDPLTCPRCGSQMEIIAFIEEWTVIRKILQHLGLWDRPQRSPPPPDCFPTNWRLSWAHSLPVRRNRCKPPPIPSFGTMFPSIAAEEPWLFSSFRSRCVCFRPRFRLICRPIYSEIAPLRPAVLSRARSCLNLDPNPSFKRLYSPLPPRYTHPGRKQIPIGLINKD